MSRYSIEKHLLASGISHWPLESQNLDTLPKHRQHKKILQFCEKEGREVWGEGFQKDQIPPQNYLMV